MENETSEQELKQLLDEGKINEDEYQELHDTIKKKVKSDNELPTTEIYKTKSKLGIGAFVLMLVGLILPYMLYQRADKSAQAYDPNMRIGNIYIFIFLGLVLETTALIIGIKSWQNDFGKIAAILSSTIIFLAVLFIVLTAI